MSAAVIPFPEPIPQPRLVSGTCHICRRHTDRGRVYLTSSTSGPGAWTVVHAFRSECITPDDDDPDGGVPLAVAL